MKGELGYFSNEALDAYLDVPNYCRTEIERPEDVRDYYDAMLALGVPPEAAENVLCENLPVELTGKVFKREGRLGFLKNLMP